MTSLKIANEYFRGGLFEDALSVYQRLLEEHPELSQTIGFNIKLCEKRIPSVKAGYSDVTKIDGRPLVSVIIPSHNVENFIDECLLSVRNQTLKNIEIIVVDDGSSDLTVEKISKHCAADSRIVLISNSRASGNSGTPRNQGIRYCSGEYISFVDSDDWIEPGMLFDLHGKASSTGSDIVSSSGFFRENSDGSTETVKTKFNGFSLGDGSTRKDLFLSAHYPIAWFRIYKRAFVVDNHIRFGETSTSADLPFSFKSLFLASSIDVVDSIYYHYRFDRPGSTINHRKGEKSFQLFEAYKKIIKFLDKKNSKVEYFPYVLYKALGDYTYNSRFLEVGLKARFRKEMASLAGELYDRNNSLEILSDYWRGLLSDLLKYRQPKTLNDEGSDAASGDLRGPKVSVIVPAYNVQSYIEQCCRSVLDQTISDIELLIIDDNSSDGTSEYLEKLSKSDPRVCLIKCSRQTGNPATPRNIGIARARGEYLAFVDSDDWVDSEMYGHLYQAAKNAEADIASARHFFRHTDNKVETLTINYKTISKTSDQNAAFSSGYFSNIWNRIYLREFIISNDIYFPKIFVSEDFCFSAVAHALADKTVTADGGWYHYRYFREGSTTDVRRGLKGVKTVDAFPIMIGYFNTYLISEGVYKRILKKQLESFLYTFNIIEKSYQTEFVSKLRMYAPHFLDKLDPGQWTAAEIKKISQIFPNVRSDESNIAKSFKN
jgi:glycosyltransferase involved in cell wall biosynthesis